MVFVQNEKKESRILILFILLVLFKSQIDCKNQHSVKLLNTALESKTYLQLTDDEIKELIAKYWIDFKCACGNSHDANVNKTMNSALKLICDHKSMDEWVEVLTEVEKVPNLANGYNRLVYFLFVYLFFFSQSIY